MSASPSLVEEIKKILIDSLHLEGMQPGEIGEADPLFAEQGLGLDSVDALELVVALEKRFDIRIHSDDIGRESFETIRSLANLVHRLQAA
ncbi:MAG: phosphopantetheine-binding protein [Acidobacteriota bacterium]